MVVPCCWASGRYFLWSGVVLLILVELTPYFVASSLLTWAETKQVKQLITHEAIISSINMVITGFNRVISQFQILSYQERNSPKRDCSHPEDSLLFFKILWSKLFPWRTVRLFSTWLKMFTQKQHVAFKMAQAPPCLFQEIKLPSYFGVQPLSSCW